MKINNHLHLSPILTHLLAIFWQYTMSSNADDYPLAKP